LAKCNKSVSKEDLEKYKKWMHEFGSTWCFFLKWISCLLAILLTEKQN
jgi:hypothetical protein